MGSRLVVGVVGYGLSFVEDATEGIGIAQRRVRRRLERNLDKGRKKNIENLKKVSGSS